MTLDNWPRWALSLSSLKSTAWWGMDEFEWLGSCPRLRRCPWIVGGVGTSRLRRFTMAVENRKAWLQICWYLAQLCAFLNRAHPDSWINTLNFGKGGFNKYYFNLSMFERSWRLHLQQNAYEANIQSREDPRYQSHPTNTLATVSEILVQSQSKREWWEGFPPGWKFRCGKRRSKCELTSFKSAKLGGIVPENRNCKEMVRKLYRCWFVERTSIFRTLLLKFSCPVMVRRNIQGLRLKSFL